ncbi:hypothetical protein LAZ67_1003497 [Cordylochernes scorpioides]|uniref:Transposase n=1 Tax=Cordylochernes scorpioides TaxID=51811 RepID=A0ABY6JXZ4_9ARAC|nr:hypothetical protein LAZ67_1003497 [Cordylochernes scorpioides]
MNLFLMVVQFMLISTQDNSAEYMNVEDLIPCFDQPKEIHRARLKTNKIKDLEGIEVLPYPAYSPDIAPSDYALFRFISWPSYLKVVLLSVTWGRALSALPRGLVKWRSEENQKQLAASLNCTQQAVSLRLHATGKIQKEGIWLLHELSEKNKEN